MAGYDTPRLHWLEAEGSLAPWHDAIALEVHAAWALVASRVQTHPLDVIVQRQPGGGIPEIGMVGHAWRSSLFTLTLDPDNPRFAPSLDAGALRRQVSHEAHHCLRMAGPGYGRTLGEALVSEGLAGQFTRSLFGNPPEPWEHAADAATLHAHWPDNAALDSADYDHPAWFFGKAGVHPRWLGYTLGYHIVGSWLDSAEPVTGDTWVSVPAATVLASRNKF